MNYYSLSTGRCYLFGFFFYLGAVFLFRFRFSLCYLFSLITSLVLLIIQRMQTDKNRSRFKINGAHSPFSKTPVVFLFS